MENNNLIALNAFRGGNKGHVETLPLTEYDKRRQANIDPESFLFQTSVDIDEKELVETARGMALLLNEQESVPARNGKTMANPWRGMLLHMEYSARKKLHIDIRMPIGLTIEETQRAYCEALGVPCDESCFSPERIIFVTDKESEIFRSPDWYAVLSEEELARRREAFLKRGLTIDGRKRALGLGTDYTDKLATRQGQGRSAKHVAATA